MVSETLKGYNIFIDLDTEFVTVLEVWFCGGKDSQGQVLDDREVQRQIYFGHLEIDGQLPPKEHKKNNYKRRKECRRQNMGNILLEN